MKALAPLLLILFTGLTQAQTLQPLTHIGQSTADTQVLLVLFSQPDCQYCDLVRNEFLLPLQQQPPKGVSIHELKVATAGPLQTPEGSVSAADFARRLDVRFYPSVLLLSPEGKLLTEPLIGISSRDFYGFYLDQAITKALTAEH